MKPVIASGYIRPGRAEAKMKKAHNIRQTVYIYGASGTGKTSFTAGYLNRRRYEYYSIAEAAAIDIPQKRLPNQERIIVIDDLQLSASSENLEGILRILEALSAHPDIWLILCSRSCVPGWMQQLYITQTFCVIDERDLFLTEKEMTALFEKWDVYPLQSTLEEAYRLTGGYPLALRIAAMYLSRMDTSLIGDARQQAEQSILQKSELDFCEYLETTVYNQWDEELSEFLMQLSIVDQFDLNMAQHITMKNNTGELLRKAREQGNFLQITRDSNGNDIYVLRRELVYSMRKLLPERYRKGRVEALYRRAGEYLELQGEMIGALEMYESAHDEAEISRLLIENSRLHPGTGYYWQLRKYYLSLPEAYILSSPVLIAAMSMLQSIMMNDEESERWYQELLKFEKEHSGKVRQSAARRRVYLDISLPHRGSTHLYSLFKGIGTAILSGETVLPEMSLTNNEPTIMHGGKDFCEWSKNDREIAGTVGKIAELLLGKYGKGLTNLAMAESLFEKGDDHSEIYRRVCKGRMQAEAGGKTEMVFVATGIFIKMEMMNGQLEEGLEILDSFRTAAEKSAPMLLPSIETLRIRLLLRKKSDNELAEWMRTAPDESAEFCSLERYRYTTKARIYLVQGKRTKAIRLLEQLLIFAKKRERIYLKIETLTLLAITLYREGNSRWTQILQRAVAIAEEYHFVRILSREGTALLPLLSSDQIVWSNESFRDQVLKECASLAKYYPNYLRESVTDPVEFSEKALQILRMQAEGLSILEIADRLGISEAGVKYYNRETYKKLNVTGKTAAVTEAVKRKLI